MGANLKKNENASKARQLCFYTLIQTDLERVHQIKIVKSIKEQADQMAVIYENIKSINLKLQLTGFKPK